MDRVPEAAKALLERFKQLEQIHPPMEIAAPSQDIKDSVCDRFGNWCEYRDTLETNTEITLWPALVLQRISKMDGKLDGIVPQRQTYVDGLRIAYVKRSLHDHIYVLESLLQSLKETPASKKWGVRNPDFFWFGRVITHFKLGPNRGESSDANPGTEGNSESENVSGSLENCVVISPGPPECLAVPILTYGGKGVAQKHVTKSEHSIVYTGLEIPKLTQAEMEAEGNLLPVPIRVVPSVSVEALDPMSRLAYGRSFKIKWDEEVASYGEVHMDYLHGLRVQFMATWPGLKPLEHWR